MTPRCLIACLVLLAGCGSDGKDRPDAEADAEADTPVDAPEGSLTLPFTSDIDGTGSIRAGAVSLLRDTGSIDLAGSVPCLAYEMTDWSEWGYILFHVVAPRPDTLNVLYLYCESDALSWVWHEDYERPMDYEAATGSCSHALTETVVADPGLLVLSARPSPSQLVTGFTLDGPGLTYASTGPGTIRMDGEDRTLYPFEVVDCTTECTSDPADGWWELHSIMASPSGRLCFGVLYLMVADTTQAQLGYPICLEPAEPLEDEFLAADWTVDPTGGGGSAPSGPRPPGLDHVLRPLPPLLRML